MLIVFAALEPAGCGNAAPASHEAGPTAVSQAFIKALPREPTTACDLLSPSGVRQVTAVTRTPSCRRAIGELGLLLPRTFNVHRVSALVSSVTSGIVSSSGRDAKYVFQVSNGTREELELRHAPAGWLIDRMSYHQRLVCQDQQCAPADRNHHVESNQ
jgi:hypothetical protein